MSIASNTFRIVGLAVALIALGALVAIVLDPSIGASALHSAAGGGGGGGGFSSVTGYLDKIAGYLIALGVPIAVLGLIAGGFMMAAGNPRATQTLTYVAIGFIVVVGSKGLAA